MANLAEALAATGIDVVYVANQMMSTERQQMGWSAPVLNQAKLVFAKDAQSVAEIARTANMNSVHLLQGLRGNGLVGIAQKNLTKNGHRQWILMETVDDSGPTGMVKRLIYRWILLRRMSSLDGFLTIGWETEDWLASRGVDGSTIFPFAYFLPDSPVQVSRAPDRNRSFRFIFVGQLIERKRIDLLIQALALHFSKDFELVIVGDGLMLKDLQAMSEELLPNRVKWLGTLPMSDVPQEILNADCLILPSRHDGWGAVVSEALKVGTPVICSDACGSAGVVRASGKGGVFTKNDIEALTNLIGEVLEKGLVQDSERLKLKEWAKCLGTQAGAKYLRSILDYSEFGGEKPSPPWQTH